MVTTGISIIALIISLLSLILSFLLSLKQAPYMKSVYIPPLKDSYDLLFDNNNKFNVEIVNQNDRDILVDLQGYVTVGEERYDIKQMYCTLEANAVTTIEIEILVQEPSLQFKTNRNKTLILIKYRGLLCNRIYKYKEGNI